LFDGRWRSSVETGLKPVGSSLRRSGITADQMTAVGLVLSALCAVAIGSGRLIIGLLLLILSAVPDVLDGAVAKASGTASPRGAFFDSVSDRVSDGLVLGGVAWYIAGHDGGRATLLPFAVLAVSSLISYERAKAESLGYSARGGLMERAERIIAICFGLAFGLLVPVLWIMLALTSFTAVQRFLKVWHQASAPRPERPESRWRTWRATVSERSVGWRARSTQGPGRWRSRRVPGDDGNRAWRRRAGTRP
jgi:CDP-diacylglycerol--glycerol-3-phosphate 3-phosphatidyltransferase